VSVDRIRGERIRELRERRLGLTQFELAMKLESRQGKNPDPVNISRWERGVTEPSLNYLRQLADLGDVPLTWFFEGQAVA
jgi:transcriptional regulator with XRE-family HTH domain